MNGKKSNFLKWSPVWGKFTSAFIVAKIAFEVNGKESLLTHVFLWTRTEGWIPERAAFRGRYISGDWHKGSLTLVGKRIKSGR